MASSLPARSLRLPKSVFSLPAPSRQLVFLQLHSSVIPPPTPTSGPLLERLPNRALPDVEKARFSWTRTLPLFLLLCGVCSVAIFNYQKSTSPTVASILYALRTNPTVREVLGDEIYFASKVPWISGELSPLQGRINISFWVKGTKTTGLVKFVSLRRSSDSFFETLDWSLKTEDGTELRLLELGDDVEVAAKSVETKLLMLEYSLKIEDGTKLKLARLGDDVEAAAKSMDAKLLGNKVEWPVKSPEAKLLV
ncbi:hypothetical protein DV737_g4668, partial [Chaetothyriales sp. CBS 132003]